MGNTYPKHKSSSYYRNPTFHNIRTEGPVNCTWEGGRICGLCGGSIYRGRLDTCRAQGVYLDLKVCRIIAFYRYWVIILLIVGWFRYWPAGLYAQTQSAQLGRLPSTRNPKS